MGEAPTTTIDLKEASNNRLNKVEIDAIMNIKNEVKNIVDKTKDNPVERKDLLKTKSEQIKNHFNIEFRDNKEAAKFCYQSLLNQLWIAYKTDAKLSYTQEKQVMQNGVKKNISETKIMTDKDILESAHYLMMLYNPNLPGAGEYRGDAKRYTEGDNNLDLSIGGEIKKGIPTKDVFYAFVEQKLEAVYKNTKNNTIYVEKTKEKNTIPVDEYNKKKDYYESYGRKVGPERKVNTGEKRIETVPGEPIHMDKQYFYKGQSDINIERGIKDQIPTIKEQIQKLQSNPKVKSESIKVNISSSVSNISYEDNQGLLARRSKYIADMISPSFGKDMVKISNPEYKNYGPERGPAYPPTLNDVQNIFSTGSDALKDLQSVKGFTTIEDVVKSIETQKVDSPFFDVIEQHMYREFQYADISLSYDEKKDVPIDTPVVDLERENIQPVLGNGEMFKEGVKVIAKNPYYTTERGWLTKIGDTIANATSDGINKISTSPKTINGITYPASEYIMFDMGSNRLTDQTLRRGITPDTMQGYQKHIIKNKTIEDWQKGKSVPNNRLYLELQTPEDIQLFSKTIIKSDKDAGRSITNKERTNFVIDYTKKTSEE